MSDYLLFLRNLMHHLNKALEDEGVDPGVRQRVVNRLMLGTPEPEFPASFGDLKPGTVFLEMGDDSNSGPGWPVARTETERVDPPMNAGGF